MLIFCYYVVCVYNDDWMSMGLCFFSSRIRHTSCALVTGVQRVLFRSPDVRHGPGSPGAISRPAAKRVSDEGSTRRSGSTGSRPPEALHAGRPFAPDHRRSRRPAWSDRASACRWDATQTRKGVGSGKSRAVRVGLGGCRILKKKKQKQKK